MEVNDPKPALPNWYWMVVGLAFFWNLFGLMQFVSQFFISEELMATLPEPVLAAMNDPKVTSAFATAVILGVGGCLMLFARKKLALPVFVISLLGVIAQNVFTLMIPDMMSALSRFQFVVQAIVIIVALLLIRFSYTSTRRGWLR